MCVAFILFGVKSMTMSWIFIDESYICTTLFYSLTHNGRKKNMEILCFFFRIFKIKTSWPCIRDHIFLCLHFNFVYVYLLIWCCALKCWVKFLLEKWIKWVISNWLKEVESNIITVKEVSMCKWSGVIDLAFVILIVHLLWSITFRHRPLNRHDGQWLKSFVLSQKNISKYNSMLAYICSYAVACCLAHLKIKINFSYMKKRKKKSFLWKKSVHALTRYKWYYHPKNIIMRLIGIIRNLRGERFFLFFFFY